MDNQEVNNKSEEDTSHKEDTAPKEISHEDQKEENQKTDGVEIKSDDSVAKEDCLQMESKQEEEKKVVKEILEEKIEEVVHNIKSTEEKVEVVIEKEEDKKAEERGETQTDVQNVKEEKDVVHEIITEVQVREEEEKNEGKITEEIKPPECPKEEEKPHEQECPKLEEKQNEQECPKIEDKEPKTEEIKAEIHALENSAEVKLGVEGKIPESTEVEHPPEHNKEVQPVEVKEEIVQHSPVKAAKPKKEAISSEKKMESISTVPHETVHEVKHEVYNKYSNSIDIKSPEKASLETKKRHDPLQIPDRIDVENDKDNEALKQMRKSNETPEGDSMPKPTRGGCNKCTIF